jgi:hypothetical protein
VSEGGGSSSSIREVTQTTQDKQPIAMTNSTPTANQLVGAPIAQTPIDVARKRAPKIITAKKP